MMNNTKFKVRDPRAVGFGKYGITDLAGVPVFGFDAKGRPAATLARC
jgi:hypothetical protein